MSMKNSTSHQDGVSEKRPQRSCKRTKVFNRQELILLILYLTRINPTHGYEIIRSMEDYSQGAYVPSPGVIYPLLSSLGAEGLATVHEADNGKKQFAITLKGKKYLDKQNVNLLTTLGKLKALVLTHNPQRIQSIDDALENLKSCIRKKLHHRDLSSDEVKQIRDAIETAARTIDSR